MSFNIDIYTTHYPVSTIFIHMYICVTHMYVGCPVSDIYIYIYVYNGPKSTLCYGQVSRCVGFHIVSTCACASALLGARSVFPCVHICSMRSHRLPPKPNMSRGCGERAWSCRLPSQAAMPRADLHAVRGFVQRGLGCTFRLMNVFILLMAGYWLLGQ